MELFFWIIILSFLIPMGMRLYRRSVQGRNQNQDPSGPFPGQLPGENPRPFSGPFPGPKNNEYRDGYTQRDYYGGFGAFNQPGPRPGEQPFGQQPGFPPQGPTFPNPGQPGFPPQGPTFPYPGQQQGFPPQGQVPYEDSAEYREQQSQASAQPSVPATPPPPSAPQGYRARKLAELDEQYSKGEIAMEEYMARRAEIMKG